MITDERLRKLQAGYGLKGPSEQSAMAEEIRALRALAEFAAHRVNCNAFDDAAGALTCDCGFDAALAAVEKARGAE